MYPLIFGILTNLRDLLTLLVGGVALLRLHGILFFLHAGGASVYAVIEH